MWKLALLLVGLLALAGVNAQSADDDAKCILCGIVVNEIQGMASENISESDIEQFLKKDTCTLISGAMKFVCDELVNFIPEVINNLDNKYPVATVCVEHGYCAVPLTEKSDPQPVPTYIVDLDLPPAQRWVQICSVPEYITTLTSLITALEHLFDNSSIISDLGKLINNHYFPTEYGQEIQGCAKAMGLDYGWMALINLGYEVTEACTSILSQTKEGLVYHVRNMDFWDGIWLTDHLKNLTMTVEFQSSGKTQFYATSFAGYFGVLSGMKPNAFSISINTRYYPQHGLKNYLEQIVAAVMEPNNTLVSFLSRQVMTNENNWASAMEQLTYGHLIADVYYIVGGINEGAVISRNRLNASDIWSLNKTNWFEVQTNYDHWTHPPWFDDRVVPANRAMEALGQDNLSYQGLLGVLSVKPVLNLQSTFTMLTSAGQGNYTSLTRWCPYPCAE